MNEIKDISTTSEIISAVALAAKNTSEGIKEVFDLINIIETDDKIPNLGYTISNEKLLSVGFEFRYNIKDCIREMIENWSEKNINPDLEYLDKGGKEYVDDRGKILNYELKKLLDYDF